MLGIAPRVCVVRLFRMEVEPVVVKAEGRRLVWGLFFGLDWMWVWVELVFRVDDFAI